MSEAVWLEDQAPEVLLRNIPGRVSHRRRTLLAVGLLRLVEHLLEDPRARRLLDLCERYADRRNLSSETLYNALADAAEAQRDLVRRTAEQAHPSRGRRRWEGEAERRRLRAGLRARVHALQAARRTAEVARYVCRYAAEESFAWERVCLLIPEVLQAIKRATRSQGRPADPATLQARLRMRLLVHDVVGNPYRTVALPQSWRQWEGGTVSRIARTIYEEKRFEEMPILADALEEAGCTEALVLEHCRQPGMHVRGCWLVDRLVGKS